MLDGAAEVELGGVLEQEPDVAQALVLAERRKRPLDRRQGAFEETDDGVRTGVVCVGEARPAAELLFVIVSAFLIARVICERWLLRRQLLPDGYRIPAEGESQTRRRAGGVESTPSPVPLERRGGAGLRTPPESSAHTDSPRRVI